MKLLITHQLDEEGVWWQCQLPGDEALWIGEGDTPKDAFNNYVNIVQQ